MAYSVPEAQGLYDPQREHDACGIGAIVNISGRRDHGIVEMGRQVLLNLQHRGAAGADELTGDGGGILIQLPHDFLAAEADRLGFALPEPLSYGVAMLFLPREAEIRRACEETLSRAAGESGLRVLGWRDVPSRGDCLGEIARASEPVVRQLFIGGEGVSDEALERRLFVARSARSAGCATASAAQPPISARPRCLAARSFTRACSLRRSCSPTIPI